MMSIHNFFVVVALAVFLTVLVATGTYCYFRYKRRNSPYGDFETLLKRLSSVDRGTDGTRSR